MWVPPEDTDPVTLHAPTRKSVALFGAVQITSGHLVYQVAPKFNTDSFRAFLRTVLRHRRKSRPMVLILDNARYHHARALADWLQLRHDRLRLEFLPPYSPELNPIERVWKLTRRLCTHNQYFPALSNLLTAVTTQLDTWRIPNAALARLCCIS